MAVMAPLAYGQPECLFDWYGFLQLNGPDNTIGTGGTCRALFDVVQPDPCFALDTATNEYTVVIDNLSISGVVPLGGGGFQTMWTGGSVRVYEDPAQNADFLVPGTFLDGTLILIGGPYSSFVRFRQGSGIGSFAGDFGWTGGTRVGDLPPCQEGGWRTFGGLSSVVSRPAGYWEAWDGQFFCNRPVAVQQGTWGAIKALYQ
jgi:hypothetical protein